MASSVSYSTFNIGEFHGVDYASNQLTMSPSRSPDMLNLIPAENGALRSRNGYEEILQCDGRINGIYTLREAKGDHTLIHHGNKISEWTDEHNVAKFTVPENMKSIYEITANGQKYVFSGNGWDNAVKLNLDTTAGILNVNNEQVAWTRIGNGTVVEVDLAAYGRILSAQDISNATTTLYVKNPTENHSSKYEYYGIDVSTADVGKTIMLYVNTAVTGNIENIKIDGVVRSYTKYSFLPTGDAIEVQPSVYVCDGIKTKFPATVDYSFEASGIGYTFNTAELSAGDVLEFDCMDKTMRINNDVHDVSEGNNGQPVEMISHSSELRLLVKGVLDHKSSCQQMGNKLYIFTGSVAYVYGEYKKYDELDNPIGAEYLLKRMDDENEAYVPTIAIVQEPIATKSGKDSGGGGGIKYEDTNLLSDLRKEEFLVTNDSETTSSGTRYYKLPLMVSPIETVEKFEQLNGEGKWQIIESSKYIVDTQNGILELKEGNLDKTPVSGRSNYRVTYKVIYSGTVLGKQATKKFVYGKANFNPPLAEYYLKKGYTWNRKDPEAKVVYMHRFLIDSDLVNPNKVEVKINWGNNGRFRDTEDNLAKTPISKFIVTTEAEEYKIPLDGDDRGYAACFIGENNDFLSKDASGYVYTRIYMQVVKDGDNYYLDISDTYALYYNRDTDVIISNAEPGPDIVTVIYDKKEYEYRDRINKAIISTKFGYAGNMDRLFVAGFESMREYEFWSEIDNPHYFPDRNYAVLGDEDTAVMGWSRINNNQMAIHKEANGSDPTIYIQTAEFANQTEEAKDAPTGTYNVLDTYEVAFPVSEGPAGDGVISQRAFGVLNGEPLALSESGVFATQYVTDVAADVRYAAPRSYYINPKLKELNLKEAEAVTFDNKYFLAVDGYVFVADGKQKYAVGGNQGYEYSYEWFPWDNLPVRVWWVNDGQLHFGTADGKICRFNNGFMDIDEAIRTYWTSPWLDFGTQAYYKKAKNVIVTCLAPKTDFCELGIDYITDKAVKNVKNYLIDNTAHSNAMKSIATNYKLKKISGIKIRVRNDNADDFGIGGLSVLYTVSGKYKG